MSNSIWSNLTPKPLQSAHDYEHRKNQDEDYYKILSDTWLTNHRCTFPIDMISTNQNRVVDFDPCKREITYKIPPTRGTGWTHGAFNQRYKDQPTPTYETKSFPLWSSLWTQYKIDKYEFQCQGTQEYKMMLEDINMKDLNDQLLAMAINLLGTYENSFCNSCNEDFGSETSPLLFRENYSDVSEYLYNRGTAFQIDCFPSSGWMALFPLCAKNIVLRDKAINDLYTDCCAMAPPSLSGVMPDFLSTINGVKPVFLRDEFFSKVEVEENVYAYKIPVFHADALAYYPALLDDTMIGADKEEDGNHFRRVFFYFMQVLHENMVANDWIVFEKQGLNKYESPAPAPAP